MHCSMRWWLEVRHQIAENRGRIPAPIVAVLELLRVLLKVLPGNVDEPQDALIQSASSVQLGLTPNNL